MDVAAPDPQQVEGYLVVLKPGIAFARWLADAEQRASAKDIAAHLAELRSANPAIDPSRYRGIQRDAIDRWWEGETPGDARRPDEEARRRIWELYGPDPCLHWMQPPWFDADLLTTLPIAREVLSLSDAPGDREIMPRWHGGPADQFGSLGRWACALNDHLLFRTAADATDYRRWYVEQAWAEEEDQPGQFQVIRADLVA